MAHMSDTEKPGMKMTYDGEGNELGRYTIEDARRNFASAEYDAETDTISVERA